MNIFNLRRWLFCPLAHALKWKGLYVRADCQRYEVRAAPTPEAEPKPGPEPERVYPKDNPKPGGIPKLVCAVLDLHGLWHNYSGTEKEEFCRKVSLAGVDYVRVMASWGREESHGLPYRLPFEGSSGGLFDLTKPNSKFDENLKDLHDILKKYHVGIYFDFFDECGNEFSPWKRNINGVYGSYDYRLVAISYFKAWIDRIIDLIGIEGNVFGLGNELHCPDERTFEGLVDWSWNWVLPLGEHLYKRGVRLPVPFSGTKDSGHKIHGFLSPDISELFGIKDSCLVLHGLGLPEHFTEPQPGETESWKDMLSGVRSYGYSDDGVGCGEPLPVEKRGRCSKEGFACTANTEWRIKTVKAFWETFRDRLAFVEFLPREIAEGQPPSEIAEDSLDVYWKLAQELWNIDIRRSY